MADPYAVLQVEPGAEPEVVEAAYRALARKYHPDVNRSPDSQERIRAINEAYGILHDAAKRAALDESRRRAAAPPPASPRPSQADLEARLRPTRPADLYAALAADTWQRLAARFRRPAGSREARQAGARDGQRRPRPPAAGPGRRLAWAGAAALVLLAVGTWWLLGRGEGASVRAYWRVAAAARSDVEGSRQRYLERLAGHDTFSTAAADGRVPVLATQLGADLETAAGKLKRVRVVPKAAEEYHFAQLEDWAAEQRLRLAYRDALVARNADLWAQTAEREALWRQSVQHQQAETQAWRLAALAAR